MQLTPTIGQPWLYPVEELLPYRWHEEIYDSKASPELIESIRKKGILKPLAVVNGKYVYIGCRRLDAAKRLKIKEVVVDREFRDTEEDGLLRSLPCIPWVKPEWSKDVGVIIEMMDSNVRRQKSPQEREREIGWRFLLDFYLSERERGRGFPLVDRELERIRVANPA